MFELDLQTEVDRKSILALEQVIDSVESGAISPQTGKVFLNVLQTAFNGVTSDDEFFQLLMQADEMFSHDFPKVTERTYLTYRLTNDESTPPVYVVQYKDCKMTIIHKGKVIKDKTFELPSECYKAVLMTHNAFIKKGLHNV